MRHPTQRCCQSHLPTLASTPVCRDQGLQLPDLAESTGELTPHHHPTAATIPSPNLPRDLVYNSSRQYSFNIQPFSSQNLPKPKPTDDQTSSQYPQAVRAGASSVVSMGESGCWKTEQGQHTSKSIPLPRRKNKGRVGMRGSTTATSIPSSSRHSRNSSMISKGERQGLHC